MNNSQTAIDFDKSDASTAVSIAAQTAATSPTNELPVPTEAQKEAGNYRKGHVRLNGHEISIENPAGSSRRPEWPPLQNHYGYIKGSMGADKASAYASQVGAEAELARAHLARFLAQITAKNQEWGAYESSMRAEGMRLDAVARQSGAMLDGYRAETAAAMAEAQAQLAHRSMRSSPALHSP